MKQKVKLIVVVPVGTISSKNKYHHIADTIRSIAHYATPDRKILIQDNSNPLHLGARLQAEFPEVEVLRAPRNYGTYGGGYKWLSLALLHVHAAYDFQVLYKMDTDALLTGHGLEDDAIDYFEKHPNVAEMGAYCNQGEPIEWPRKRLLFELSNRGWLIDRKRCALLRYYYQLACGNGYSPGEHVLGGVAIYNPTFINKLVEGDFLLHEDLRRTTLGEDHLWVMLGRAVGMEPAAFHIPEHPLAVVWRGMPCSPQAVVDQGVKAIHSTRFWNSMNEDEIRAFFQERRNNPQPDEARPQLAEALP